MQAVKSHPPQVTHARLLELCHYNPKTGVFTSRFKRYRWPTGREMGFMHHSGYRYVLVDSERLYAHRLAWFYVHGEWPPHDLDHRNRNRDDNRIKNLRPANDTLNAQNRKLHRHNKSGATGVHWNQRLKKWQGRICFMGEQMHLGVFKSKRACAQAYQDAKAFFHPDW